MADPAPGFCYLMSGPGGLCKIGMSIDPAQRATQLGGQAAGVRLLHHIPTGNMPWLERFLHEAYSHRRVKLEWFRLSPGDIEGFYSIGPADDIDQLPSWLVAKRVLNEADGFEWGEQDDDANTPGKRSLMVRVSDEDHAILTEIAKENGRTLTAEMGRALKDHFRKHGLLP